jgi:hypothetical protein
VTLAHVSNAILVVHNFTRELICISCVDDTVRSELWARLIEDLTARYRRAMDHARFLLSVERVGRPSTVNPELGRALAGADLARASEAAREHMDGMPEHEWAPAAGARGGLTVKGFTAAILSRILAAGADESGDKATGRKVHDVLRSYYGIARGRFVDVVCQQAVEHFLLGADGPLRVLDEGWVLGMPADLLDNISGEPPMDRTKRDDLRKEIQGLMEAKKVVLR